MENKGKIWWLWLCAMAVLLLLGGYAAWLQLFHSTENDARVHRQQDRFTYTPGERGAILDRNGIVLDKCIPQYALALRIEQVRDPRDTRRRTVDKVITSISSVAVFLGPEYYRTRPSREAVIKHISMNAPMPLLLWKQLPPEDMKRWASHKNDFPGTELVMSWKRHHEYPNSAYHVRGITGYGAPHTPPKIRNVSLNFQELTGKSGIEAACNEQLHGIGGVEVIRTDVMSYRNSIYDSVTAQRGHDINLTIDIRLQKDIENIFRSNNYSGAFVMMDLRNGDILASVSEPSATFTGETSGDGSMVNRVLAGYYPPGSTLKPLLALTALEKGIITPDDKITCEGFFPLPNNKALFCSHIYGCGELSVSEAIGRSCNTFFCEVGHRMGNDVFSSLAADLPLGKKIETELRAEEKKGIAFTPETYNNCNWNAGDLANASIGQGAWIITPLQLLEMTASLATGKLIKPTFVLGNEQEPTQLTWSNASRQVVLEGMRLCTEDAHGTARSLQLNEGSILAKTGTAETGNALPHAIIIAAFPADAPRLAAVCVVEHVGSGGKFAAPVMKTALKNAIYYGY